jgi:hypothetical protein
MNELLAAPLTNNETILAGIARAKAIEKSELMALENFSQSTGAYFEGTEVSVRSIAKHWSNFMKQPGILFCHPQQLDEAFHQFMIYLKSRKTYSQSGANDIQVSIKLYVNDKLLEIAFKGGWLTSEKVKQEVNAVLVIRDIFSKQIQLNNKMLKSFLEKLQNGDIDLATLPERSVLEAFSEAGVILIEMLTNSAKLALEVQNELA